jgi:hypothetical protein
MLARYKEIDLALFAWVSIEKVKRFNLAIYRLFAKLGSSNPGQRPLLLANELAFRLPSNSPLWDSDERDEWE